MADAPCFGTRRLPRDRLMLHDEQDGYWFPDSRYLHGCTASRVHASSTYGRAACGGQMQLVVQAFWRTVYDSGVPQKAILVPIAGATGSDSALRLGRMCWGIRYCYCHYYNMGSAFFGHGPPRRRELR